VRFDDWMLALHVLSAFALVAGLILFWTLIVVGRRMDTPEATLSLSPVAKVGTGAVGVGMVGTIVFGLWLAFSVGNYNIWDAWIVIALVLWVVGSALGRQTGQEYMKAPLKAVELQEAGQTGPNAELLELNRTSRGLLLQALTSLVVLLIILDMIWKPWA
jgi:uncharacterized membrane protein